VFEYDVPGVQIEGDGDHGDILVMASLSTSGFDVIGTLTFLHYIETRQLHQQTIVFASENGFGVVGYANVAIRILFSMIKIVISIMFVNLFITRCVPVRCNESTLG
jgi:hypothetical protein